MQHKYNAAQVQCSTSTIQNKYNAVQVQSSASTKQHKYNARYCNSQAHLPANYLNVSLPKVTICAAMFNIIAGVHKFHKNLEATSKCNALQG
jgi:hypothetical protein